MPSRWVSTSHLSVRLDLSDRNGTGIRALLAGCHIMLEVSGSEMTLVPARLPHLDRFQP